MNRTTRPYRLIDHDVLIDEEVYRELCSRSWRAEYDRTRSDYPLVLDSNGAVRDGLHRYTYGFINGFEKLQDDSLVVHHKRPNKRNCRVENLELLSRADHARKHRLLNKKKMEQVDVLGLWRPREKCPLKHLSPDAPLLDQGGKSARNSYTPPEEWADSGSGRPSLATQLRRAETVLEEAFDVLDWQTQSLDSHTPIPKTITSGSSVDKESQALGLSRIRLGCTKAEAALVRLLAKHEKPEGGFDLKAAGAEVGVEPALLPHFLKRPSVAMAVQRWQRYRRLPKVATASWPRRRAG